MQLSLFQSEVQNLTSKQAEKKLLAIFKCLLVVDEFSFKLLLMQDEYCKNRKIKHVPKMGIFCFFIVKKPKRPRKTQRCPESSMNP